MNDESLSIQMGPRLKERLAAMARTERRSLEDEAIYLVESGVQALEGWKDGPFGGCFGERVSL